MSKRSEFALRFAFVSGLLFLVAGALGTLLLRLFPVGTTSQTTVFPPAFLISTVLLAVGSVSMSRACAFVRRERQIPFRRSLLISIAAGTLFVTTQSYALTALVRQTPASQVAIGAKAFVAVLAALHAMHFVIAMMFLVFITVQAFADRYDHEYYWGVTICAWFWHVLGIVWVLVLAVIAIAMVSGDESLISGGLRKRPIPSTMPLVRFEAGLAFYNPDGPGAVMATTRRQ